ncbi:hypothetical protein ASPVEDRAFT_181435 [Aspergillus versicolor CBS 583.65]|uniref:tRNA(Ile)-lysidine synthetase n=1 Tax=Aspergillus versicolor CBS 583.65 TaxID=1036611 RepID=A0A1L9P3J7_ASPVE|nr:uncharacterized protein ASPVEDRAFT_181435 [Aspergillus versicolor CBS 583.65]OJI96082.1 hypothetical protein ASPVEDRAFT_181435 [Aspergillus versicolor CBS 583.65]
MAASCILRSKSAGAITVPQFTDALSRTWLESGRFRPGTTSAVPRRLGLAVSGGADSMALAYLCRQWERQKQAQARGVNNNDRDEARVTAFVVDHKAREESTQEANTVATWLRKLGITTQILPLDWTGVRLSAFETQARGLRFQALGKACRNRGIEALLLGHHQDDIVETTIWRLCSGARGAGLAGIAPLARIPECHGLHGVSGSGETVTVDADEFAQSRQQTPTPNQLSSARVSTGGILICRPLLSFPKSNLVATCHENKVPFVSDRTNFDPTLTPRNAIRSLLSSNSLPCALQNPSILSLVDHSRSLIHDSLRLSDRILESQCRLLNLRFASGSITIQFKSPPYSTMKDQQQEISAQRLHELQSLTLRRITELVSPFPDNHFSLSSFEGFTSRVFHSPATTEQVTGEEKTEKKQRPFTLGGVLFHPLNSSNTNPPTTTSTTNDDDGADYGNTSWLLTRQPYMRRRDPILHFHVPNPTSPRSPEQESYIHWTLWDNRFWIPVPTRTLSENNEERSKESRIQLVIRPLRQSDLSAVRRLDTKNSGVAAFFARLDREAPGQSRFTVPVLAISKDGADGAVPPVDVPLALPTIDLMFPRLESTDWTLTWEWKYKMIDLESLKLMGSV